MCGNIGSGKSTAVKQYVDKGYICIARDALRYMIGAGKYTFDKKLEPTIFQCEKKIITEFMKLGVNIIIDEVGVTQSLRLPYLELAEEYKYKTIAYVMPRLDMKTCVDRRMKNPHGRPIREEWEYIWRKFDYAYQEPTLDEGFNKIIYHKEAV